jgi:hypothetical protein
VAANVTRGKRKSDGDIDGEYTNLAAKCKESGNGGEYALATKRARVAKYNLAYIEFSHVVYGTDSDLYHNMITYASTIDEHQTRY